MSDTSPLKENPVYEPPDTPQPITQDTVLAIPTGKGRCPNCNLPGFVESREEFSQRQHLLCWLCCIPYCIPSLKFTRYTCRKCGETTKEHDKNVCLKILMTIVLTIVFITIVLLFLT